MTYLFINPDNEYPRHPGDVLIDDPNFDGVNLPEGWKVVTPTTPPTVGINQVAYEIFPEFINDEYVQSWSIRDLTQEEINEIASPPTRQRFPFTTN